MLHPLATVTGMFGDDLESWRGQSGALIQSTEFYASDPSRGFLRGARWSLTPGGGALKTALAPGAAWGDDHHAYLRERLGRSVSWVILGKTFLTRTTGSASTPVTSTAGVLRVRRST